MLTLILKKQNYFVVHIPYQNEKKESKNPNFAAFVIDFVHSMVCTCLVLQF